MSASTAGTSGALSPNGAGKYAVIYADPPWQYKVYNRDTGSGRSAEAHYPTMTTQEICALPVQNVAARHSVLLMWVTWPTLLDSFLVAQAWGFKYQTCAFLWAKLNKKAANRLAAPEWDSNWFISLGFYTRANTEPCLLFTHGHPKRISKGVRQLVVASVREHSHKPDEVYERIEKLFAGPYIELFARARRPGWSAWGNQVESDPLF